MHFLHIHMNNRHFTQNWNLLSLTSQDIKNFAINNQ